MKKIFLAAAFLSGASCAFAAQETLNIDLLINGEIQSIAVNLPTTSALLEKSTMKNIQFEPTSGNCSGVNTSKIARQYPSGVAIQVVAVPEFEGERLFQMTLKYSELIGTEPFQFNKNCVINKLHGERFEKTSTFGLKRGQPLEIFSQKDSVNPANNISVRAEWR